MRRIPKQVSLFLHLALLLAFTPSSLTANGGKRSGRSLMDDGQGGDGVVGFDSSNMEDNVKFIKSTRAQFHRSLKSTTTALDRVKSSVSGRVEIDVDQFVSPPKVKMFGGYSDNKSKLKTAFLAILAKLRSPFHRIKSRRKKYSFRPEPAPCATRSPEPPEIVIETPPFEPITPAKPPETTPTISLTPSPVPPETMSPTPSPSLFDERLSPSESFFFPSYRASAYEPWSSRTAQSPWFNQLEPSANSVEIGVPVTSYE